MQSFFSCGHLAGMLWLAFIFLQQVCFCELSLKWLTAAVVSKKYTKKKSNNMVALTGNGNETIS
ncbi:MAG: hypothetical protein ACXVKM_07890 [Flavisolibacter sp.]